MTDLTPAEVRILKVLAVTKISPWQRHTFQRHDNHELVKSARLWRLADRQLVRYLFFQNDWSITDAGRQALAALGAKP
jgi:hypothetical protein